MFSRIQLLLIMYCLQQGYYVLPCPSRTPVVRPDVCSVPLSNCWIL